MWSVARHSLSSGFRPEFLTVIETPKSGRLNDRFREELPLIQVRRKVFFPIRDVSGKNNSELT